jgi:hypothetical protein
MHRDCNDQDSFEPFIYAYIAFNGWAVCVADQDRDSEVFKVLKRDPRLTTSLSRWLNEDPVFRGHVEAFRGLWPIFSAKNLRALRIPIFRKLNRREVIAHYRHHGAMKFKPEEDNPQPTLTNILDTLYQVRCNLFHGEKCVSSEGDQRIVGAAFRVLVIFLEHCLHPVSHHENEHLCHFVYPVVEA